MKTSSKAIAVLSDSAPAIRIQTVCVSWAGMCWYLPKFWRRHLAEECALHARNSTRKLCISRKPQANIWKAGGASEEQHMLQILGRGAHPDTQLCLVLCAGCVPTKAATWVVAVILFYFILMSVWAPDIQNGIRRGEFLLKLVIAESKPVWQHQPCDLQRAGKRILN